MPKIQVRVAQRGFTLLEAIVVLALIAIAMFIGAPVLSNMLRRSKVESWIIEVAAQARAARLQSVKESVQFYVQADLARKRVVTYRENGVGATGFDAALDEQVRELPLPGIGLIFGGPGAPDTDGTNPIPGLPSDGHVTFRPDGSIEVLGSCGCMRFDDTRGNYLEVKLGPAATGRVQILKYDAVTNTWRTKGQGGKEWTWK